MIEFIILFPGSRRISFLICNMQSDSHNSDCNQIFRFKIFNHSLIYHTSDPHLLNKLNLVFSNYCGARFRGIRNIFIDKNTMKVDKSKYRAFY